jgi:hypothetical protein
VPATSWFPISTINRICKAPAPPSLRCGGVRGRSDWARLRRQEGDPLRRLHGGQRSVLADQCGQSGDDQRTGHVDLPRPQAPARTARTGARVINSDPRRPSEIVEFTTTGKFVAQFAIDPNQGGSFGLAFAPKFDDFVRFAAVNDNALTLSVWQLPIVESSSENR